MENKVDQGKVIFNVTGRASEMVQKETDDGYRVTHWKMDVDKFQYRITIGATASDKDVCNVSIVELEKEQDEGMD